MATKPSDEEISDIGNKAYYAARSAGASNLDALAKDARAIWNAGYAAGLKDAREVCDARQQKNRDAAHQAYSDDEYEDHVQFDHAAAESRDCADAIAKLALDQGKA